MTVSLFTLVKRWADSSWNLETCNSIIAMISSTLLEIGHGESALGKVVLKLQAFFNEMIDGYGLLMTDEEMQFDLHKLMESGDVDVLHSIFVEVNGEEVTITNLNELKESSDPDARVRYQKKKIFDQFVRPAKK